MFDVFVSVALSIIELLTYKLFMDTFLGKGRRSAFILVVCILFCDLIAFKFQNTPIIKMTLIIVIFILTWTFYYKNYSYMTAIFFLIAYGIYNLGAYIGILLIYSFFPRALTAAGENDVISYCCALVCAVFNLVIIMGIHLLFENKKKEINKFDEWPLYLLMPVFTIVVICIIMQNWSIVENRTQFYSLMGIVLGLVAMNFIIFYLIDNTMKRQMQVNKARSMQERMEAEWRYYTEISDNLQEQRKLSHEFNNQLSHIGGLVDNKKYDELERYCREIQISFDHKSEIINTNNSIIDVILNTKMREMMQKGIPCSVKVGDLSGCILTHQDMVLVLSNIINNAIEASEKCKEKFINFEMRQNLYELMIKITNKIDEIPIQKKGKYLTTKTDTNAHGLGIENVKEVIDKYGGDCCIVTQNYEFSFLILIPLH